MHPPEYHARLGARLGYPACCVAAFMESSDNAAVERGSVFVRYRSPEEMLGIIDDLGVDEHREHWMGDLAMRYVPCEDCIGREGWLPWTTDTDTLQRRETAMAEAA